MIGEAKMQETITVAIGGQNFTVGRMKFRQLKYFAPAFIKFDGLLTEQERFDYLADAVIAALCVAYPQFDRSVLDEMPTTPTELLDVANKLAEFSGLFKKKVAVDSNGDATGEATGKDSTSV